MKNPFALVAAMTAGVLAGGVESPVPVPASNANPSTGERIASARGHKGWRGDFRFHALNQRQRRKRERQTR